MNNIFVFIIIIIIIIIFLYFYGRTHQKYHPDNNKKKKVRFNHKVKYNTYQKNNSQDSDLIDVDQIVSDMSEGTDEKKWFSTFGKPLITPDDKDYYAKKIKKSYHNYQKSISDFTQHLTDDNTIIKTDTTIDLFKPDNKKYQGKSIKEIYDQQVEELQPKFNKN